jgi:hypothetical protein
MQLCTICLHAVDKDLCNPLKTGNETFLYDNLKTILDKFNHIVLNMQLTGTYYTKYLSYICVMHKAHYIVLCCL